MTVQLQLYPASFLGFPLHPHHSASEQSNRSSLAGPYPFDIFMRCLCIKLNVDKSNGPEYKGSQSQQTLPGLHIFHVHCTAWLPERASGMNVAPRDPVPSGLCHEPSLRPGFLGLTKVFWEKGSARLSSPFSQGRRKMPEDPAPDSSFAKELEINQQDSRRWAPRQRRRPKNKPLLMSVGFVGFSPFFSVC